MSEVFVTPVSSVFSPVDVKAFSAITGVADSIETTIVTHAVVGNETFSDILVGGSDYARFNFYVNSVLQFVIRTGPQRYGGLSLQRPLQYEIGDVIDVKVIHYNIGNTAEFECTILGV